MEAKCKMSDGATTWPCAARWCPLYHDCLCEYESRAKRPPTNADRIRAMGDDELAEELVKQYNCGWWDGNNGTDKEDLETAILLWLKKPAPEEGEQDD